MALQDVDDVFDLEWAPGVKYRDVRHRDEVEQSKYAFGQIDMPPAELHALHRTLFDQYYGLAGTLLRSRLVLPALDYCLKCSHMFNLLDASGGIGVTERMAYILRVRQLAVAIAKRWAGLDEAPAEPVAAAASAASSAIAPSTHDG
jgi:glycyl-tRNA synthetase alpha chain